MDNIMNVIPAMLSGEELDRALEILPVYDEEIGDKSAAERLVALSDMYSIYVPNQMSREIYSKLYLAFLRSMQKKQTKLATQQYYENHKAVKGQVYNSIIGGSDSFTVIGMSGVGKSSAVSRVMEILSEAPTIELQDPYQKILPAVVVQTPFDSSVKGLLLEILRVVDERLETKYYSNALRARATTDMLIGSVSQVALSHIGLLVVDEIQHVVSNKHGKGLVSCLVQLINNSGISICMVGTPECEEFFSQAMQLARRSIGLKYYPMKYGEEFCQFCETVFRYQYVKHRTELTDAIIHWLYEHSQGNLSIVVTLLHDAQEKAIITGNEIVDMNVLEDVYRERMGLLHEHIAPKRRSQTSKVKAEQSVLDETEDVSDAISIVTLVTRAKNESRDILGVLRRHIKVEGVSI